MKNKTVAEIILEQIGGNQFIAITGAKHLIDGGNYLSFKLPGGQFSKYNYVKITLSPDDLYDIELGNIRRRRGIPEYKKQVVDTGIFFDKLVEILEGHTGLYFSL